MHDLIQEYKKNGLKTDYGKEIQARRLFLEFCKVGREVPEDVMKVIIEITDKFVTDYDADEERKAANRRKQETEKAIKKENLLYIRHVQELMAIGYPVGEARKKIGRSEKHNTDRQYHGRAKRHHLDENEEYWDNYYDYDSDQVIPDQFFEDINMEDLDFKDLGNGIFQKATLSLDNMAPHPDILEIEVIPEDPFWNDCQPTIDLFNYKSIKPFACIILVKKNTPEIFLAVQSLKFRK